MGESGGLDGKSYDYNHPHTSLLHVSECYAQFISIVNVKIILSSNCYSSMAILVYNIYSWRHSNSNSSIAWARVWCTYCETSIVGIFPETICITKKVNSKHVMWVWRLHWMKIPVIVNKSATLYSKHYEIKTTQQFYNYKKVKEHFFSFSTKRTIINV